MKLIFVCSSLGGGGAERVAVNLANTLTKNGHSVTIFLRRDIGLSYSLNGAVLKRVSGRGGIFGQVLSLRKLIDESCTDAVISFTDVPNVVAYFSTKLSKKNPVFMPTVHTNLEARDIRLKKDFRFYFIRYLHKLSCRSGSNVVCVSKGSETALVDYYGAEQIKAVTVWNPVIENSEPVRTLGERKAANVVRMVAAGRLTTAKNYFLMLDVVKRLNTRSLVKYTVDIYGQGELEEELKVYASKLGIVNLINFKGFVSDLRSRLAIYDIFVFTSDWEGFGNVLVEALCAGIPIISTNCPSGPREILADGKFGRLVPVGNVETFCNAVEDEIRQPLEFSYEELCAHLDNFREGVVAQKYIELVENVKSSKV